MQRFQFFVDVRMDSLTENIRKEARWQIMSVDDVLLCGREKDGAGVGTRTTKLWVKSKYRCV